MDLKYKISSRSDFWHNWNIVIDDLVAKDLELFISLRPITRSLKMNLEYNVHFYRQLWTSSFLSISGNIMFITCISLGAEKTYTSTKQLLPQEAQNT